MPRAELSPPFDDPVAADEATRTELIGAACQVDGSTLRL